LPEEKVVLLWRLKGTLGIMALFSMPMSVFTIYIRKRSSIMFFFGKASNKTSKESDSKMIKLIVLRKEVRKYY